MARRIDDHSFWAGKGEKGSVFPDGVHLKEERSAEGAGDLRDYYDTSEKIRDCQDMGERKAVSHKQKSGYRY